MNATKVNFSQNLAQKKQDAVYFKMTEKLLQYVAFKLVSVMKLAEQSGLSVHTGELFTQQRLFDSPYPKGQQDSSRALFSNSQQTNYKDQSPSRNGQASDKQGILKRVQQNNSLDRDGSRKRSQEREEQHHQWLKVIKKIFKAMQAMEAQRPADQPKFSMAIYPLLKFLKSRYDFKTGKPTPAQMRQRDRSVTDEVAPGSISDYYDQFSQRKQSNRMHTRQNVDETSNYSMEPGQEPSGNGGGKYGALRANTSFEGANLSFNDQISFTSFLESANLVNDQQAGTATHKTGKAAKKETGDQFSFEEQDNEESETDGKKEKKDLQGSPDGIVKQRERQVFESQDPLSEQKQKKESWVEKAKTVVREKEQDKKVSDENDKETVMKLHDSDASAVLQATVEENQIKVEKQIDINNDIEIGRPNRKTQTPSALGSTQIQNSITKASPPVIHKIQTQELPEFDINQELEKEEQIKVIQQSMESQPKAEDSTAGGAQGLPFPPVVFLEHGGGSISSSTLQPVESKRTMSQLENRNPTPPPEIVAPLPGHSLIKSLKADTPDYASVLRPQPLPKGTTVVRQSLATNPSLAAHSSAQGNTEQTEHVDTDDQKVIHKQEDEIARTKWSTAKDGQVTADLPIERGDTVLVLDEKAVHKEYEIQIDSQLKIQQEQTALKKEQTVVQQDKSIIEEIATLPKQEEEVTQAGLDQEVIPQPDKDQKKEMEMPILEEEEEIKQPVMEEKETSKQVMEKKQEQKPAIEQKEIPKPPKEETTQQPTNEKELESQPAKEKEEKQKPDLMEEEKQYPDQKEEEKKPKSTKEDKIQIPALKVDEVQKTTGKKAEKEDPAPEVEGKAPEKNKEENSLEPSMEEEIPQTSLEAEESKAPFSPMSNSFVPKLEIEEERLPVEQPVEEPIEDAIEDEVQDCGLGEDNIAPSFESQRASKDHVEAKSRMGERQTISANHAVPSKIEANSVENAINTGQSTYEEVIDEFDRNDITIEKSKHEVTLQSPPAPKIENSQAYMLNTSTPIVFEDNATTMDQRKDRSTPRESNAKKSVPDRLTDKVFQPRIIATSENVQTVGSYSKESNQYMFEVSDRVPNRVQNNFDGHSREDEDDAIQKNQDRILYVGNGKRSSTSQGQPIIYFNNGRRGNRTVNPQHSNKKERSSGLQIQIQNQKHQKTNQVSKLKIKLGRLGQEMIKRPPYNPSPYTELFYASMKAAAEQPTSPPNNPTHRGAPAQKVPHESSNMNTSIADASKRKWGGRRMPNTLSGEQQPQIKENRSKSGDLGKRKKEEVIAVSGPVFGNIQKFVKQHEFNKRKQTLSENEEISRQRTSDGYEMRKQIMKKKFQTIQAGETGGDIKSLRSHKSAHTVTFDGVTTVQQQQVMERIKANRANTLKPQLPKQSNQASRQQLEVQSPVGGYIPQINDAATLKHTYIHKGYAQQAQVKGTRELTTYMNNLLQVPSESRESLEPSVLHPYILPSNQENSDDNMPVSADQSQHSSNAMHGHMGSFGHQKSMAVKSQSSLLKQPAQIKEKIYSYQQRRLSQNQYSTKRTSSTQQAKYIAAMAQSGVDSSDFYQRGKVGGVFRTMQRTQNVYRVPPVESAWTRRFAQGSTGVRQAANYSKAQIYSGRGKGMPSQDELTAISGYAAAADIPMGYLVNFSTIPGHPDRGVMLSSGFKKGKGGSSFNKDLTVDDLIEEYDAISFAKQLDMKQKHLHQLSVQQQMGAHSGGDAANDINGGYVQIDPNTKEALGMIDQQALRYASVRPKSRDQAQTQHASLRNLIPQEASLKQRIRTKK